MSAEHAMPAGDSGDLPMDLLVRAVRARWRLVVASMVVLAAAAAGASLLRARRYEAIVSVATVGATRGATLGQGISAAFLSATNTGLQATPALIGRLLSSSAVASAVARSKAPGDSRRDLGQVLDESLSDQPSEAGLVHAVQKVSSVDVDRETGLITIRVALPDSALARLVVQRLVDEATLLFRNASRAQAREIHVALEARVDSARRQMANVEDALFAFASSNRSNSPYSRTAVEQQRLERQVVIAQGVLVQALQEREGAIGKELEEAPALVVVEPLPAELPRLLPETWIWIAIGGLIGMVGSVAWAVRAQVKSEGAVALASST